MLAAAPNKVGFVLQVFVVGDPIKLHLKPFRFVTFAWVASDGTGACYLRFFLHCFEDWLGTCLVLSGSPIPGGYDSEGIVVNEVGISR